jgi:hypothetical protein
MLRFILYLILFYFVIRIIKLVKNYLSSTKDDQTNIKGNPPVKSKFNNVEEADFKEIKSDSENKNE